MTTIPNMLLVMNGKGGVAKTSLVANISGIAALSGWKVLAIDLDPQGNLARDLGYLSQSDGGLGLFAAAFTKAQLTPLENIRPNLDVIPGGPETIRLADQLRSDVSRTSDPSTAYHRLANAILPLSHNYDLIVVDLPPGEAILRQAAARCAKWIVIPTKTDDGSIDGLNAVFGDFLASRDSNPELTVLGVAITLVNPSATAILAETRIELSDLLGEKIPVFESTIRFSEAMAVACRRDGVLPYEYELTAISATRRRFEALRLGKKPERVSSAAGGLASDYQRLVEEILASISSSSQTGDTVA
nr:ParA family protein [Ferrimicrobium acidiphilum]